MITRRRVIGILAGATALPVFGTSAHASASQWRGIALGAEARIILDHPDAKSLIARAVAEIHRLEGIFSLYRQDSQISQLNKNGVLSDPAFEMIELLSICSHLNARTEGAFDPTVQTLWALYAQTNTQGTSPTPDQINNAMKATGWHHVAYSAGEVSFRRENMGLTLNGIAQGYIADKITRLFKSNGVQNVLVNTGEISAIGHAPDASEWTVALGTADGETLALRNAAIATSAPLGTTFDAAKTAGHIIDPRNGKTGGLWSQVSVVTKSAALADGLSTAFCLMDKAEIDAAKGDSKVYLR